MRGADADRGPAQRPAQSVCLQSSEDTATQHLALRLTYKKLCVFNVSVLMSLIYVYSHEITTAIKIINIPAFACRGCHNRNATGCGPKQLYVS